MLWRWAAILVCSIGLISTKPSIAAASVLIDFESLTDLEPVTNQFSSQGVLFSNTTALVSGLLGGTLNEINFPPHSGDVVITHNFSEVDASLALPMVLTFNLGPVSSVSGFFTYTDAGAQDPANGTKLSVSAFNPSGDLLGTTFSSVSSNLGNQEFLQLTGFGPIGHVEIAGGVNGTFTMDDLQFDTASVSVVPEPASLWMLGTGLMTLIGFRRRQDR